MVKYSEEAACGQSRGEIDHFCYWGDRNFIEVDVGD